MTNTYYGKFIEEVRAKVNEMIMLSEFILSPPTPSTDEYIKIRIPRLKSQLRNIMQKTALLSVVSEEGYSYEFAALYYYFQTLLEKLVEIEGKGDNLSDSDKIFVVNLKDSIDKLNLITSLKQTDIDAIMSLFSMVGGDAIQGIKESLEIYTIMRNL